MPPKKAMGFTSFYPSYGLKAFIAEHPDAFENLSIEIDD
jgi:hypothetical protein